MKKVLITLFCLSVGTIAVNAQDKKPNPTLPATEENKNAGVFKFKDKDNTHDYGDVPEGPTAEYDFEFKNVGKEPIIISEAHGSCGCTVPKWPHDPILPKKTGVIHVTYNTQGRPGPITKDVFITSNASDKTTVLHIRGTVKPKAPETTPSGAPAAPATH